MTEAGDYRIYISPTEHGLIGKFEVSSSCENHGCDALILINPRSRKNRKRVGIQRKEIKDLLASMADGRLAKEIRQMGNLAGKVLIVEGKQRFTTDGVLVESMDWGRPWSKKMIRGLLYTARMKGLWVIETDSLKETEQEIRWLAEWWAKDKHTSLDGRPGPVSMFGSDITDKEWGVYLLMSLPGVGVGLAERIYDMYGVPWEWSIGVEELIMVDGVGQKKAETMLRALQR